jgi:medium-chain acyl-[acyl-carrier-protein] hydrolase
VAPNRWYSVFLSRPAASVRLYCLPCAGGSASMFRAWADVLPPTVELRAIRLPGRHARYREPAFTDCETAAAELADALGPELRRPYVLFGHSMGALIAYRLIRVLERRTLAQPTLYVGASWTVQGVAAERMPDPDEPDERFVDVLRRLGGVPPEVLSDPEKLAITLPVLRADFQLCRSYVYRPDEAPLSVPTSIMGGLADRVTPLDEMTTWREHTLRYLGLRRFAGGHFFLRDDVPGVVGALVDDLATATRKVNLR